MKIVEIVKGTYGYRPAPGKSTKPIRAGKTVPLPDEEADRLVSLRVARYAGGEDSSLDTLPSVPPGGIPEYSQEMRAGRLRQLMEDAGLNFHVGMTKAEMVAELDGFYGEGNKADGLLPSLEPESPVV